MERNLDLSRWREAPRGIAYRRWAIVDNGLRQLLRLRFFRVLLGLAWSGGLAIAALGVVFSQSVATGGWLESLATRFGPRYEAMAAMLGAFVVLFPDVCIGGVFTLIFWAHSFLGLWLSLAALTVLVPQLITRDRGSNALTVYLSRPLTSVDYLCGKFGIIVCVLVAIWTGPLLFGWVLGMLFATDSDFIVYSLAPLWHALLFNAVGLVALAAIALGVSACSRTANTTTAIWVGLWLILGAVAAPPVVPDWLKRTSFQRDLNEVRQTVFRVDSVLTGAGEKLPFLDQTSATNLAAAGKRAQSSDFNGSLASLGAFVALSAFVFFRRLRPE